MDRLAEILTDEREFKGTLPIVFHDGETYRLVDGWHRWHAHKKAGRKEMKCEVWDGGFREAQLCWLSANATHGKSHTDAGNRNKVTGALKDDEWSQLSDDQIAERCAVSQGLVQKVRQEIAGQKLTKI